jgi:hypothetical protein
MSVTSESFISCRCPEPHREETLSDLFFDRMARELIALFVEARNEKVTHELDEEVERITGKECDDAARTLSKEDFRKVAEEAMGNIRKRKKKSVDAPVTEQKVAAYS